MQSMTDVRQLLKRFGAIIYTGDKMGAVELMMEEVKELKMAGLIDQKTFREAMAVLMQQSARMHRKSKA